MSTKSGVVVPLRSRFVVGMRADATSYADASKRVLDWAASGESRYVCVAPVHTVMETYDSVEFQQVVNSADLVTPDGMPVVWSLRLLGIPGATRVYGPNLTPIICERAAGAGLPVGFYGGSPETLAAVVKRLKQRFPSLDVVYEVSPPFRLLTAVEDEQVIRAINNSGARILFVGLGCPKQEQWMARHRGRINAVMLGVGAAFDFIAGTKRQAPPCLQRIGMEWAFRLATEPRRLWKRYLKHNPRYVVLLARQILQERFRCIRARIT